MLLMLWTAPTLRHRSAIHLAGGNLKQLRAQLGNDIAITAFREGKLPFPDGTIIAALHWNEASSLAAD
jgi:hypothetical protein